MIQSNYYDDNVDMQNHVNTFIDWTEIIALYENGFEDAAEYQAKGNERLAMAPKSNAEALEYYNQILNAYGDIFGNEVSQIAQQIDKQGLKFEAGKVTHPKEMEDLFIKMHEAGLHPTGFKRKYGGLGIPHVVKALVNEIGYRADTSFAIAAGCVNLAAIMEVYASEEMCAEWLPKLIDNKYAVTMGLSEPDFGSDLPNIRTRAENKDGKWFVTGTKRFQTMACGVNDHPSAILTLARSGQAGARGLSFFLIEGKDVQITGLEKKLGLKASATCEVAFENAPAHLIGEEGHGLSRYVIGMLNGARMGVASQGTGMATAAYFEAKKYANERIQFGRPIAEIPAVNRMLKRMEREIAAMRCLMIEAATSVDRYHWPSFRLKKSASNGATSNANSAASTSNGRNLNGKDFDLRKAEKLADVLTPMSKYYISELCNSLIYDALQVFGGSGFCEDYDIARLYRDARITNIYDGTTQIQINAAIGGVVSGMSDKGVLRAYLDDLSSQFSPSELLLSLRERFEGIVKSFKALGEEEAKGELALETVESCTRLLCGYYLEKTTHKLSGEEKQHRMKLAFDFNVDSEAKMSGTEILLARRAQSAKLLAAAK